MTDGTLVASPNLANERRFNDQLLRELNLAAGLVMPLCLEDKVLGAIGAVWESPREFTADETALAESIAGLLLPRITRWQLEGELRRSRTVASTVLEVIESLVLTLDAEGRVQSMNRACREVTGFAPSDFQNRSVLNVLFSPDKTGVVRQALQRCFAGGVAAAFDADLITKHGNQRSIRWTLRLPPGSSKKRATVILSGIDCTDLVRAKRRVERLEQQTARLTAALEGQSESREAGPAQSASAEDRSTGVNRNADVRGPDSSPDAGRRPAEETGKDRRTSPRLAFRHRQRIAAISAGRPPTASDFFEVDCRDVSAGGFAFYLDREPGFNRLVVALGKRPEETFFVAEIVRVTPEIARGRRRVLVGCRFIGRISSPGSIAQST